MEKKLSDISREDCRRYYDNLNAEGKRHAFVIACKGEYFETDFLAEQIIRFKNEYPKMELNITKEER